MTLRIAVIIAFIYVSSIILSSERRQSWDDLDTKHNKQDIVHMRQNDAHTGKIVEVFKPDLGKGHTRKVRTHRALTYHVQELDDDDIDDFDAFDRIKHDNDLDDHKSNKEEDVAQKVNAEEVRVEDSNNDDEKDSDKSDHGRAKDQEHEIHGHQMQVAEPMNLDGPGEICH